MTKKPNGKIIEITREELEEQLEEYKKGCSECGFACHITNDDLSSAIMDLFTADSCSEKRNKFTNA